MSVWVFVLGDGRALAESAHRDVSHAQYDHLSGTRHGSLTW